MALDVDRLNHNIDPDDLMTIAIIDLGPALPYYEKRATEYLAYMKAQRPAPDVILIQGVRMDSPTILNSISGRYRLHVSQNDSKFNYCNVTAISNDYADDIVSSTEIRIMGKRSKTNKDGSKTTIDVELAPDCLADSLYIRGHMVRFYNYEALRGLFYEPQRVYSANLLTRDAYKLKTMDPDYKNAFMYLGGDLHADPDFESVRLLGGKMTRDGVFPSAFNDVWAVMHDHDGVDGATERQVDVFDKTVKIPQLVRPRRHTYFLAYDDVFGKAGSPVNIEINGNRTTDEGIPFSDDYGLTMTIWVPALNEYTTDDED